MFTVGVKKKSGRFKKFDSIYNSDGVLISGDENVADLFASHFANYHGLTLGNFSDKDRVVESAVDSIGPSLFVKFSSACRALLVEDEFFPPELVSQSEVKEVILSRNKLSAGAGADALPNRILKLLDDRIIAKSTVVFNQLIASDHFPSCWKRAHVILIPKAGKDNSLVGSWRPISLLPCISKVYERLLAVRMRAFLNNNSIIPSHQFGFMPAHSTCHPLAISQNKINANLREGLVTTTKCLDIQAAFDTVWHKGLIYKLIKLRFPGYIVAAIRSFLLKRSFTVKVGNAWSRCMSVPAGVPQGSVLGPLLFIISNYDIPTSEDCLLLQFADDTSITFTYNSIHGVERKINDHLERLHRWFVDWKFNLNTGKTELIHFFW